MTFREMLEKVDGRYVAVEWNKLSDYEVSLKHISYLWEELLGFNKQENPCGEIVVKKQWSSSVIDVFFREDDIEYAFDLMDRRQFIDCEIVVENIKLPDEKTIAIIFDEITFYGLQNRQILDKRQELVEKVESIDMEDLVEIDLETL